MAKTPTTPDTPEVDAGVGQLDEGSKDILIQGGTWEDTFASGDSWGVFQSQAADLDNGIDEINNFHLNLLAAGGDVLDVGDVLSDTASDSHLGGYLQFTVTDATHGIVTLSVDANGSSGGAGYTTLATIAMPNMSLSSGTTSAEILNTLLQNHEIKF